MKIYQIHQLTAFCWETFFDKIVGSYMSKEKAETKLKKLETMEMVYEDWSNTCNECELRSECDKAFFKWEHKTFKLTEVEVEE